MNDPTNPFADPMVVRVQTQQSSQENTPQYTFAYNSTEGHPNSSYDAVKSKQDQLPQSQPTAPVTNPQLNTGERNPNFPPIPSSWTWLPFKPCFYFNIAEEIHPDYQSLVKYQYYFIIGYFDLMLLNFIGVIACLIADYPGRVIHLIVALFIVPLFVFLVFILQYFLFYRAVRLDNPNYYFWYLVNTVVSAIILMTDIIGMMGSGWNGAAVMIYSFDNENGSFFIGLMSLFIVLGLIAVLVKIVHTAYNAHYLYMISKHKQLSNAINLNQGRFLVISNPTQLP